MPSQQKVRGNEINFIQKNQIDKKTLYTNTGRSLIEAGDHIKRRVDRHLITEFLK